MRYIKKYVPGSNEPLYIGNGIWSKDRKKVVKFVQPRSQAIANIFSPIINNMSTEVTSEVLNLGEHPLEDNSIQKLEDYETKISNPDTEQNPRFTVDYTDQWVLPSKAYLRFTGKIVKNDDTDYGADDNIAFVNNGFMQLFQRAEYKVDNQVIERVENPGDATLITSLVDYPADYVEAMGDTLMIAKDTGANLTAATNTGFVARKKVSQL